MPQVYLNGEWLKKSEAAIPLNDAGFLRGDGVFETILLENGLFFRMEDHIDRLFEGLRQIRIIPRESKQQIYDLLYEFVRRNKYSHKVIRIVITRGIYDSMPWNYQGPNSIYISASEPPAVPEAPVKIVYLDESQYPIIRKHPAIKSLNYLGNILAKMDAYDQGAFEPVLYNSKKQITEGGIRNIFYVKDGVLLTPPLHLGILSGTMRNTVIELAESTGIPVKEAEIQLEEVDQMDEAFLTSTSIKMLPVFWEGWTSKYPLTKRLSQLLEKYE